jgi:hypothetical protein
MLLVDPLRRFFALLLADLFERRLTNAARVFRYKM